MLDAYLNGERVEAQRIFLRSAGIEMPEPVFEQIFGQTPDPQVLADEAFQFEHLLRGTTRWEPDVARLTASSTRVIIGIGESSAGQLCDRSSRALAARAHLEPTMFPGGHVGFVDDPPAFAARLREVLAAIGV